MTRTDPGIRLRLPCGALGAIALWCLAGGTAPADEKSVSFTRDIRPILSDNCFFCHGPDARQRQADLRLDTAEEVRRVLQPGKPAGGELLRRVTSRDPDELMPPPASKKSLTPGQIDLLRRWIEAGAPWDAHWSFTPLRAPHVPQVRAGDAAPLRNPIDAFVQAILQREGLVPSPEAPRETLLRRVALDLTGLPPTLEELDAFLADPAPDAYERVVERLLKSPAFGERMAWDWLDAARYADSNGYQGDRERNMWPWRDWVVDAFNRNLPFDEFTVWQLAGDLLPEASFEQQLATGFCRNHMINGEGGRIPEENRVEYVMDMTETMGTVWLGLTLNCCRCHDHKFDPLTNTDYYRLFAYFNQTPVDGSGGDPQTPPVLAVPTPAQQQQLAALEQRIEALGRQIAERSSAKTDAQSQADKSALAALEDELKQAQQQLKQLESTVPKVMVMRDLPAPRKTFLLERGLYNQPGEEVAAGVPASFPPLPPDAPPHRLSLARWLVSRDNPLTARVAVNRIWQRFFGVGLVKTTEDFGAQGEVPPQGKLLDWLAASFRDGGWDVKALVRLIVTSHTYRQSSQVTAQLAERDPDNRLLARGPRFRLPAWMLRDQALAAAGLLVARRGGPPVNAYQPAGVWEEATFGTKKYQQDHGEALYRRSLYTFWRRIIAPTMFFDNASRQTCTVKVFRTNTPLHALLTLNDVTYVEAARALAERSLLHAEADADRLAFACRRVLARRPTEREGAILLSGLNRGRAEFTAQPEAAKKLLSVGESPRDNRLDAIEHAAWTSLCLALLNLDEALTKE